MNLSFELSLISILIEFSAKNVLFATMINSYIEHKTDGTRYLSKVHPYFPCTKLLQVTELWLLITLHEYNIHQIAHVE